MTVITAAVAYMAVLWTLWTHIRSRKTLMLSLMNIADITSILQSVYLSARIWKTFRGNVTIFEGRQIVEFRESELTINRLTCPPPLMCVSRPTDIR